MRRRASNAITANPVLIGAATVLIVIVAVFLAYNAGSGLPFVPTYDLRVQLPDANGLVAGNDVAIGGNRVGAIDSIEVQRQADNTTVAVLNVRLETSVDPLPVDSTVIVRSRSVLGLKYLSITKGKSKEGFENGAVVPVSQATPEPVDIDDVFNTFNAPTRTAIQRNLATFGDALAGRGQALNETIVLLDPLLTNLIPVMENLSAPSTQLRRFFDELATTARAVAPVAETQADLFVNLDTTFTALAEVARPFIQETITESPPALEAAIRGFPIQRAFLQNSAELVEDLGPGVDALRTAAPVLADTVVEGRPTLERLPELNRRLTTTFRTVQAFADDPLVPLGLRGLNQLVRSLTPTLADITPQQTVCGYTTLWFRNVASLLSVGDSRGTWQRFTILVPPAGPNNEGGPSSSVANGPNTGLGTLNQQPNFLHVNPYPNTAAPGQEFECEAGREAYNPNQLQIGNTPGNQGINPPPSQINDQPLGGGGEE
jgi:virulence factor Mce-like protein